MLFDVFIIIRDLNLPRYSTLKLSKPFGSLPTVCIVAESDEMLTEEDFDELLTE